MKHKIISLIFFGTILFGYTLRVQSPERMDPIKLLTVDSTFVAGTSIALKFSSATEASSSLYLSNSYGSVLLKPTLENGSLNFSVPEFISNKTGVVNWILLNSEHDHSGSFYIEPKASVSNLESYLGPPSIQAGGLDFSMLVVIPTDKLDNPLKDNTLVKVNTQFLEVEEKTDVYTKHRIAYQNIFSPKQSGRFLVGSECLGTTSKEYDINVLASIPTDFTIREQRHHNYADGNQITTLLTSQIKDAYDNIVEDGTFVEFYIKNNKGSVLKASGNTIDGIATAKIIHPDRTDNWKIKALINGMAESDTLVLNYEQVFNDFNVTFSKDNRTINIGPLKSFMGQLIPDGFNVTTTVFSNQNLIQTINKQTISGSVVFKLNPDVFPEGNYTIKVNTAGLEKIYKSIQL